MYKRSLFVSAAIMFASVFISPGIAQADDSVFRVPSEPNGLNGWFKSLQYDFDVDCNDGAGVQIWTWGGDAEGLPDGHHTAYAGWRTQGSGEDLNSELWTSIDSTNLEDAQKVVTCGSAIPDAREITFANNRPQPFSSEWVDVGEAYTTMTINVSITDYIWEYGVHYSDDQVNFTEQKRVICDNRKTCPITNVPVLGKYYRISTGTASGNVTSTATLSGLRVPIFMEDTYSLEKSASVSINSPANGFTTNNSSITISGSYVVAPQSSASISVNGVDATVSVDGVWSANVPLAQGNNIISASLTSLAGNTATASINVTYSQSTSSGGGDGGGGGGGGGSEEPQPISKIKKGKVLGAKTPSISIVDRKAKDFISNKKVPLVVDQLFSQVFGRKATLIENAYWKGRARSDKATESKLRGAMQFYKTKNQTLPAKKGGATSGGEILNKDVLLVVEQAFSKVFGRKPTPEESSYWKKRARSDKKTDVALNGAMQYWKSKNLSPVF